MNKADELIACIEGEIAKRDEELAACRVAVENCELFRNELSAIKAQEPVEYQLRALIRDVTNIPEAGYYMPQSWHDQVIALSLSGKLDAPVSEAKAQGVVIPEQVLSNETLWDIRNHVACNEVLQSDDSLTICVKHGRAIEAAVLARLNAAPAAPAADAGLVEALEEWLADYDSCASNPDFEPFKHVAERVARTRAALAAHRAKGVV